MNILFLGGDERMLTAFKILKEKYDVSSLGLFRGDNGDICNSDAIILPVPATRDGKTVNCVLTDKKIPLDSLMSVKRGAHILTSGYRFSHYPQTDYTSLDEFALKNAALTAEGAISTAIEKTDFALFKSKILIIGFGRVGKILLSRLSGFDADITVSARNKSDFALLDVLGIKHTETADVPSIAQNFDIIFNTVDIPLFNSISELKKCILFDLSTKGCTADSINIETSGNIFKLPGIPGKTAPVSAGKIIAETIEDILTQKQKY